MALIIGTENADSGMSLAIYQEMDLLLSPPLQAAVDNAQGAAKEGAQKALDEARKGWKKLAYAIAKGVSNHLASNLEVRGVTVQGNVAAQVSGNTATATGVVFTQNNDGTGRVW